MRLSELGIMDGSSNVPIQRQHTTRCMRVRLYDKQKSFELPGNHLGLFEDKVEIGVRPIFTFGDEIC